MARGRLTLNLRNLEARHPGLSSGTALAYEEAARVCLDRHHTPPANIEIRSDSDSTSARLDWIPADARLRRAWGNEVDAIEAAAYAMVIASVEIARKLCAVYRAETGTGADYYVSPIGAPVEDLEECRRLEVSGVGHGDEGDVRTRLRVKVAQVRAGKGSLPAMAGVVGFRERLVLLQTVDAT